MSDFEFKHKNILLHYLIANKSKIQYNYLKKNDILLNYIKHLSHLKYKTHYKSQRKEIEWCFGNDFIIEKYSSINYTIFLSIEVEKINTYIRNQKINSILDD